VPTLHTIGMLTRPKLPIRLRLMRRLAWAVRLFDAGNQGGGPDLVRRPFRATGQIVQLVGDAAVQGVQRVRHSLPGKYAYISRLGLLEKFRDITCSKRVVLQARLQPLQPQGRQHQQPRDECNDQPGHKQQVNTAKVSAGSRISTLSG
jgi:hypothetical protein